MTSPILTDLVAEGRRIVETCELTAVHARLLGGVAIAVRARGHLPEGLHREFKDIDLVVGRGEGRAAERALTAAGYEPNRGFNAMRGDSRLLLYDLANQRQLDVFVHEFRMCHELQLTGRIAVDDWTLPLADLLLTKLQVVGLNVKDRNDAYALLLIADFGDGDGTSISRPRLTEICGSDWGWHHTVERNLARLREQLPEAPVAERSRVLLESRLTALQRLLDEMPRTRGWRLRAKVGERRRWYELPEEVDDLQPASDAT